MTNKHLTLIILCLFLAFVSCQKQLSLEDSPTNGGNTNPLTGEYTLVNLRLQATTTGTFVESGVPVKSLTTTDYISKNNQGGFFVDDNQFIANNVSFSVDTTLKVYFYAGGILLDSVDAPFAVDVPSFSGNSPYTRIDATTLNFPAGFNSLPAGTGIPLQNGPATATYSWSGDTLILKSPISIDTTQEINGTSVKVLYEGNQWIRLKKK